jgi:hypothetical protein
MLADNTNNTEEISQDEQIQRDWDAYYSYINVARESPAGQTNAKTNNRDGGNEEVEEPAASQSSNSGSVDGVVNAGYTNIQLTEEEMDSMLTSSKDISFPYIERIMGLPPIGLETDADYFESKELLEASFPTLKIIASFCDWDDTTKPLNVTKLSPEYKFAVIPDSAINYSHTNQYNTSNIESDLSSALRFNTAGEIRQLMKTSSGALHTNLGQGQEYLDTLMKRVVGVLKEAAATYGNEMPARVMTSLAGDVARGMLAGARIDLPNIWQNSQTTMNWTFTIELRTMATDPNSELYRKDIIEPLGILLKLALPVGGYNISFVEPPYISARLGNFLDVKLGGISNIVWTAPLNEFNLNEVPRHIEVSITIQDLYSVMVQAGSENEDFPTMEKHISNFTKNANNRTAGKKFSRIFRNEYNIKTHNARDENIQNTTTPYHKNYNRIEYPKIPDLTMESTDTSDMFKNYYTQNLAMQFNPSENKLSVNAVDLNNANLLELNNITHLTGNVSDYAFLNGTPKTITTSSLKSFDVYGVNSISDTTFAGLESDTKTKLNSLLSDANISNITDGIITTKPTETIAALATVNQMTAQNIDSFLSESNNNLSTLLSVSDNITKSLDSQIKDMVLNSTQTEQLSSVSLRRIKHNNPVLDNQLRYSKEARRFLEQVSAIYEQQFVNNMNVRNEFIFYNQEIDPTRFNPELSDATSEMLNIASIGMKSSLMNSLLSPKSKGINRIFAINLEA